jgi:hypothetical protein
MHRAGRGRLKPCSFRQSAFFLVGRLTIPAAEGLFTRESTGTETLTNFGYGDPSSNAESMCFSQSGGKIWSWAVSVRQVSFHGLCLPANLRSTKKRLCLQT